MPIGDRRYIDGALTTPDPDRRRASTPAPTHVLVLQTRPYGVPRSAGGRVGEALIARHLRRLNPALVSLWHGRIDAVRDARRGHRAALGVAQRRRSVRARAAAARGHAGRDAARAPAGGPRARGGQTPSGWSSRPSADERDRPRAGGPRPPRLHQPRPRRATSAPTAAPTRCARRRTRCSTTRTRRACATSTPRARTAWPRSSSAAGCARASPDGVFVASKWGYTYTADWRIDAEDHEVKDLSVGPAAAPARRDARAPRARGCGSTRSTRRRSRAACSRTARCSASSPRCAETGVAIGLTATGARQADTIDAALATGAFDAVQATWNLHERSGRRRARPRARRRAARDRQGGGRQRPADRPRRRRPRSPPRRASAASGPTRSRSRPRSRSRGRTSCSAARRRPRCSTATSRRCRSSVEPGLLAGLAEPRRRVLGDALGAQLELVVAGRALLRCPRRTSARRSCRASPGSSSAPSLKRPLCSSSASGPSRTPRAKSGSSSSSGESGLWSAPSAKPESGRVRLSPDDSCSGMRSSSAMPRCYPVSARTRRSRRAAGASPVPPRAPTRSCARTCRATGVYVEAQLARGARAVVAVAVEHRAHHRPADRRVLARQLEAGLEPAAATVRATAGGRKRGFPTTPVMPGDDLQRLARRRASRR